MSKNLDDERADRVFDLFVAALIIATVIGFIGGCVATTIYIKF